ncbi:MAG: methyltransferase domain-containing protein [Flavobacteriaceae bacterium]|jgi:2-polyprenyl-6-hydroxyphenyl methylase/3-demethylubiquinone-9 3-methyltransferase|nr:methyltransferase domain-containing protein [Flavobacteriaceae bacterium]
MRRVEFNENWNESIRSLYEYDLLEIFHPFSRNKRHYQEPYRNRRDIVLTFFKKKRSSVESILDVGAAQGNFSLTLAEIGFRVTWNDIRTEILDYVQEKYEYGNVEFLPGNIFDLDLKRKYNCVLLTEIIEHVAHPDLFLAKCQEFVDSNGFIVMTTPNGRYFRNKLPKFSDCSDPSEFEKEQFKPDSDGHIFLLHPDEISKLALGSNLRVEEIRFFNNFLTCGHLKLRYLLKYIPRFIVDLIEIFTQNLPFWLSSRINCQTFVVLVPID